MHVFLKASPCRVSRSLLELGSCGKLKGAPEAATKTGSCNDQNRYSLKQNNKGTSSEWDQAQPVLIAKPDALLVQRSHEAA